ncbi:Rrf2 family transcriptional regulator [Streptomyces sp. SID10853]|uniref:RrF2 family transcriptional regulator n=1 Tax=Streptomyces sp. SID10853 TaxID=2706028 RepID=UPI0013C2959A|nr:Rrf2 family transcriptional regulator [Streptomyces sp. SID10853]NDZ77737.1 Rrf2 family transcriptional regulator [Streptomyces sp. SID10853]
MKLSQGVEWGLHCAVLLAQVPPGGLMRRDALAGHFGLPEAYLSKHLQAMTRAGVLFANSGPKGGYRLARAAESISVLDVVEAIEGTAAPFVCQEIRQRGTGASSPEECRRACMVNTVMDQADEAWRASLRSVSVAGLVDRLPGSVRTRNEESLRLPAR